MGGSKGAWVKVVLLLIILEGWRSEGCLEQERSALFQLKHFFFIDPYGRTNWVVDDHENYSDCCEWRWVVCNTTTGRVIRLDLDGFWGSRGWGEWYLNASLFTPFQQLEYLRLSSNNIAGFIHNEGLERLSKLNNLKFLFLDDNLFNKNILSSLSGLSSLRGLSLANNTLEGNFDFKGLSKLEFLDLSWNNLNRSILSSLTDLSSLRTLILSNIGFKGTFYVQGLSKLEFLDLSGNNLNSSILFSLTALSSLRTLILSNIGFKGTFYVQELDSLSNLQLLDMSINEITKLVVPKDYKGLRKLNSLDLSGVGIKDGSEVLKLMGSLPSLKALNLASNNFTEKVICKELQNFINLEELILDGSTLHISFLQSMAAFTSVKFLMMDRCKFNGVLRGQGFINFKNLEELWMSGSTLHVGASSHSSLSGTILDQGLCELVHLQVLFIEHNDLRGNLPWCLANMTSLQALDVSFNQLTGNISLSPLVHMTSLEYLMLSNNHFRISTSLKPFLNHSRLKYFGGGNNQIYGGADSHSLTPKFQLNVFSLPGYGDGGTFPKFLFHQHDLKFVDLSHVMLLGEFPNWLLENNTNLDTLILSNNSLSGPFRMPIHPLLRLRSLNISNNFFHGHIPKDFGAYLPTLWELDFSGNSFNGSIPSSFGDLHKLRCLDLSSNQLTGEIPEHLMTGCIHLELLVLSDNRLQGHMFSRNFNLTQLSMLKLDDNLFSGEIPDSLSNCSFLTGLYLSDNNISGKIPRWLGNLSFLEHIIMPNNHLEGSIPAEFCQLDSLQILDFSENNLSRSLPSCFNPLSIRQVHLSKNMLQGQLEEGIFRNSSSVVTLDLSHNRLKGRIPDWIDRLSQLSYLILANNDFEGEMPMQLCQLNQLRLIDLSHNNLNGQIPPCIDNTTLHKGYNDLAHSYSPPVEHTYVNHYAPPLLKEESIASTRKETIVFTTKERSESYKGKPLNGMFGVDLSCNKFTGEIPLQIGYLTSIRALNLSHNNLIGSIPPTFSNLKQIESLDLSNNKLNGKIPPQLVELTALAVFSVANNNLSGKIPERTAQFATFNESSYKGNILLCGPPLSKSCNENGSLPSMPDDDEDDDNCFIDVGSFNITFTVSYVIVVLGIFGVLYVNPYWRRRWFYNVEIWAVSCYYFFEDNLIPTRFCHGNN